MPLIQWALKISHIDTNIDEDELLSRRCQVSINQKLLENNNNRYYIMIVIKCYL